MFKTKTLILLVFMFFQFSAWSQVSITGKIQDGITGSFVAGAHVELAGKSTMTSPDGAFELSVIALPDTPLLLITKDGFNNLEVVIDQTGTSIDLGVIKVDPNVELSAEEFSPVVTSLVEDDDDGNQSISGLLSANRDPFTSAAAYVFGPMRFRVRGYGNQYSSIYFNGAPMNDIERGGVFWGAWGGLNDVMRNRSSTIGLGALDGTFGDVAGATELDTRASNQRKQFRVTVSNTNRFYRNRLMATYSTGMMDNGWAISLSGSKRWSQEGYAPGTFYDAYGYFMSVDKKVNDAHSFNLTVLGAPRSIGKQGAATKEMFDLAGTNYYNSYWGYQNGKIRNSRVSKTHVPIVSLRHDWTISEKTTLTTSVLGQAGRNGSTALDWVNAPDPRPDYYRYLPSYIDNEQASAVEALLRTNEEARQIDWHSLYNANRASTETIKNVDGIDGNDVTGLRARYIVEERRYDSERLNFATTLQSLVSDALTINGGLNFQYFKGSQFKVVDDLLGADFYLDIDKFAAFDTGEFSEFALSDVDAPNRLVGVGDIFGYNFENHVRTGGGWIQAKVSLPKVDFFVSGSAGYNQFWRNGLMKNGKFPEDSFGESEKSTFFEYAGKGGITYKINGRNFIVANGSYSSNAPLIRHAFVSPRTRNQLNPGLTKETIYGGEASYVLNAPYLRVKLTGFYTQFKDKIDSYSFYLDNAIRTESGSSGGFVNYQVSGADETYMGLEFGASANITGGLSMTMAAAAGNYFYSNRPTVSVYLDEQAELIRTSTVYIKNYKISRTPQNAYTFGLSYRGKQYWTVYANINYFHNNWIGIYPERRTSEAVSYVEDPANNLQIVTPDSDLWNSILDQEQFDGGFTLDISGRKSFKFGDHFVYLNLGIANVLDNTNLVTGGYEQRRFDFEGKDPNKFPSRYYYGYGRTYFLNLAYRM